MEDYDSYYSHNDTFLIIKKENDERIIKDFSHSLPLAKKICEKDENLRYKSCFEVFHESIYNLFYIHFKNYDYIEIIAEVSKDNDKITKNYCIFTIEEDGIQFITAANKNMIALNVKNARIKFLNFTYINLTHDKDIDEYIEIYNKYSIKTKKLYIVYAENFFELMLNLSKI